MEDTITASHVQDLSDALDHVGREIDLCGSRVAAASPYGVIIGALREQWRALDRTAHDLHTHLAKREAKEQGLT